MGSMIDRVARKIAGVDQRTWDGLTNGTRERHRTEAICALSELRDPAPEMLQEAAERGGLGMSWDVIRSTWAAMIDVALKP